MDKEWAEGIERELRRLGDLIEGRRVSGGKARAANLSPAARRELAQKAARGRWR